MEPTNNQNPIKNSRKLVLVFALITIPVLVSLIVVPPNHSEKPDKKTTKTSISFLQWQDVDDGTQFESPPLDGGDLPRITNGGLEYDFYRQACPEAESFVRLSMERIHSRNRNVSAGLLRLLFHDCFIKGCDASVLLDDSNGDKNRSIERNAIPNQSLTGFDEIDTIKEELENACPGTVSCSDILAIATRDAIILGGGPFYPVLTGRRDNEQSFFAEAQAQIPRPNDRVEQTLNNFARRGFDTRETVALLGGHNIGKMGCNFVQSRISNFSGTGQPDPSIASDFLEHLRLTCQVTNGTTTTGQLNAPAQSPVAEESQDNRQPPSIASGTNFDAHYYLNLIGGRGILFSDQQLMSDPDTAAQVRFYASDAGTTFRRDFARVMVKLSNLGVLTNSQGQVRTHCSLPVTRAS